MRDTLPCNGGPALHPLTHQLAHIHHHHHSAGPLASCQKWKPPDDLTDLASLDQGVHRGEKHSWLDEVGVSSVRHARLLEAQERGGRAARCDYQPHTTPPPERARDATDSLLFAGSYKRAAGTGEGSDDEDESRVDPEFDALRRAQASGDKDAQAAILKRMQSRLELSASGPRKEKHVNSSELWDQGPINNRVPSTKINEATQAKALATAEKSVKAQEQQQSLVLKKSALNLAATALLPRAKKESERAAQHDDPESALPELESLLSVWGVAYKPRDKKSVFIKSVWSWYTVNKNLLDSATNHTGRINSCLLISPPLSLCCSHHFQHVRIYPHNMPERASLIAANVTHAAKNAQHGTK
jgi:hypothetical protein